MEQPIVVTGMGIISAIGRNRHETLASLLDEQSGVGTERYPQTTTSASPAPSMSAPRRIALAAAEQAVDSVV